MKRLVNRGDALSNENRDRVIEASELTKQYQLDGHVIEVLKGITLTLESGKTTAVVGPSGSGKSTLLHLLGLLECPSSGRMLFKGFDSSTLSDQDRTWLRLNEIGFVFQFHHLLPEFTAIENVQMPGLAAGHAATELNDRARMLLNQVGLDNRLNHKPGELSGGEQQRVAFARALMNDPALILADEPTGNLDNRSSLKLQELLWEICQMRNAALLLVTHNETIAHQADSIYQMDDGHIRCLPGNA